jgi:hypothetical protein
MLIPILLISLFVLITRALTVCVSKRHFPKFLEKMLEKYCNYYLLLLFDSLDEIKTEAKVILNER